jgi:hypothetical protein
MIPSISIFEDSFAFVQFAANIAFCSMGYQISLVQPKAPATTHLSPSQSAFVAIHKNKSLLPCGCRGAVMLDEATSAIDSVTAGFLTVPAGKRAAKSRLELGCHLPALNFVLSQTFGAPTRRHLRG